MTGELLSQLWPVGERCQYGKAGVDRGRECQASYAEIDAGGQRLTGQRLEDVLSGNAPVWSILELHVGGDSTGQRFSEVFLVFCSNRGW
jgi:hypothetical protein